ncbi:hypothetical protein AQUCO_04900053v1 [Aquilegia coerulea]|uniref:F-box domain-containing protein n=1 Tax=Aquilegia coerulea TaxID=218851 RepID=A0A2G5CJM3_AQUCA|nr:hypothetical protein AQUCO_04900053v1 [Aquilegia coerulea]
MSSGSNMPRKRSSIDMISNLPEEVIVEILQYLPIREAVGTSKLSRRWRYQWMGIHELKFNDATAIVQGQITTNLANFINNVLLLHNRPITRFEVCSLRSSLSSDVDRWLLVLSRNLLQHLTLSLGNLTQTPYCVPSSLFSCQYLKTLELDNCVLALPPQFKGFKFLTGLTLKRVHTDIRALERLVKNSTLQSLNLVDCTLSGLCICARNHTQCHVWATYESINFHHTSKLEKGGLSINFQDTSDVLANLCQFPSTPSLKIIEIHALPPTFVQGEHFWNTQLHQKEAIFQNLQVVNFNGFRGMHHELRLVKFFLENARVLQSISIKWMAKDFQNEDAYRSLAYFRRASPKARMIC